MEVSTPGDEWRGLGLFFRNLALVRIINLHREHGQAESDVRGKRYVSILPVCQDSSEEIYYEPIVLVN